MEEYIADLIHSHLLSTKPRRLPSSHLRSSWQWVFFHRSGRPGYASVFCFLEEGPSS